MDLDEDRLSDSIIRFMLKGIHFKHAGGELQAGGNESSVGRLDADELRLLRERRDEISRLVLLNSEALEPGQDAAPVEGRCLGKHLILFWQQVASGKFDEFFTNLTHSVTRLPKRVAPGEFARAARLVIARHPALRLTLTCEEGGSYRMGFADRGQADVRIESAPAAAGLDAMKMRAAQLISERLDNAKGMVRLFLVQNDGCSLLGVVINHFVSDLRSVASVTRELVAACYDHPMSRSEPSIEEEHAFIREISDVYDYASDPRFALARAFWRNMTSNACYRRAAQAPAGLSPRATNIRFFIDTPTMNAFLHVAKTQGVAPLNLFIALHAGAQKKVFGSASTISILTVRELRPGAPSVGKMDDVKPLNVDFEDPISCAREVGRLRRVSARLRFLPYDLFPELFYRGKAPPTPFLNLMIGDNVGRRDFFVEGEPQATARMESITYESGAEKRFDFEDYSLQATIRESGIYGMLSFPHDNLSPAEGEALVDAMISGFQDLRSHAEGLG